MFWVIEDVINLHPNVLGVAVNRSRGLAPTARAFQDLFGRFRGADLL